MHNKQGLRLIKAYKILLQDQKDERKISILLLKKWMSNWKKK